MVNGNYILYGERPSSESEIVDDHVHTRTNERKIKRKAHRTANELQHTLNMAQLDNETDSVKYEKKIKEPRLLRYVPTTDVEENFVTEKFETYDLKPTEERPRRYAFTKKPKNPTDGSVNYAYSRSSSSCSSPNGNLPTISEHAEQYGTYRVRAVPSPTVGNIISGYESKLDKYFSKPREIKKFAAKVGYSGSHPDSLYRVQTGGSGAGAGKMARVLRILRWPVALVAVCIALAVFIYFLMPDNMEADMQTANETYWEPIIAGAHSQSGHGNAALKPQDHTNQKTENTRTHTRGTKTSEIDFYDAASDKNDFTPIIDTITETSPHRKLSIPPVFPTHIIPEVQYGNEKADSDKLRTPKLIEESNVLPEDSTLKPHITQKPEKPLAIYFNQGNEDIVANTETLLRAETVNEFTNYDEKQITKKAQEPQLKTYTYYKDQSTHTNKENQVNIKQYIGEEPEIPLEVQEFYDRLPLNVNVNFTSGHSKLFGISIEDAEKMSSTTQSSLYNTRVSPTLPTWRDRDDTTTKNYPININSDVPQCRSTRLALCRGVLPYDLAGTAATVAGVDVTALLSQIEYLVATNCSDRVRHFACALLEPECNPPKYPPKMPCFNLCKAIVDNCDGLVPRELIPAFNCEQYSKTNCVAAKAPCYARELACGDGSCVPREWMCDGTQDCPSGEDEAPCTSCNSNEFRCRSGGCISKRWVCDGYADCPESEDEAEESCGARAPSAAGEEAAGSAPAPAVRRPNRLPLPEHAGSLHKTGEIDSSKELLVTSDSSNVFKRNFTRRPSLSRLTPYSHPVIQPNKADSNEPVKESEIRKLSTENDKTPHKGIQNQESGEEVNVGDLGFFEDFEKIRKENSMKRTEHKVPAPPRQKSLYERVPAATTLPSVPTKLDKSINKLERVIDGAALLQKAIPGPENFDDSPETNATTVENVGNDDISVKEGLRGGSKSAHASPCPSGELRCVDGRCITLEQLCDGTIDCTDHADEDNCYT